MDRDSLQLKELQDALIDAFPNRSDLERMVLYGLNQDLSAIARDGNLQQAVFDLIRWSRAHGELELLVTAALKENSQNLKLKRVAKRLKLRNDQHPTHDVAMDETTQNIPTSSVTPSSHALFSAPHPLTKMRSRLVTAVIVVILIGISIIITVAANSRTPSPVLPSVAITSPANESHVPGSVTIEGTASNTLNGKELWILVAAEGMQDYFPQPGPVQVGKDGKWSSLITVGKDTDHDKKFVLYMALVDIAGKSAIDKYFMQTPSPDYIGIKSLEGIQLMSKINVIRI